MRIFLRHIGRTIRKHPVRPVLLIITVALAVCTGVVALRFRDVFLARNESKEAAQRAQADIIITLSAQSQERMLFAEDVTAILGDSAQVLGDYSLTAFYGTEDNARPVAVKGVSLEAADEYYDFDFYGYGEFTDKNLLEAVVISKTFAEQNSLWVGDTLCLSLFDISREYTIQAVADDEVCFFDCDVLIDISSATKMLAQKSEAIASLGDSFAPSNRILIRLNDVSRTDEAFEILSEGYEFSDDLVQNMRANSSRDVTLLAQNTLISLMSILICFLSAIVIYTSMSLLSCQRETEYALFAVSGADRIQIGVLKLTESMIYAVIGGGCGLAMSPFALDYAASLFPWYGGGAQIGAGGIAFGFAFAVLLMGICTIAEIIRADKIELALRVSGEGYPKSKKKNAVLPAIFCMAFAAFTLSAVTVKADKKYIFAILAVISGITVLYLVIPHILKALSGVLERALSGSRAGALIICIKNVKNNYSLQHIGRLLTVLVTVLIAIGVCSGVVSEQEAVIKNALDADILVSEMPYPLRDELKEKGIADGIAEIRLYRSTEIAGKYSVFGIAASGDAVKCLSSDLLPEKLPGKGQVVISKGLSYLCGAGVGDVLPVSVRGNEYELEVSQIQNTNANVIFINMEDASSLTGIVCINLADGESREGVIGLLEANGVMAWSTDIAETVGIDTIDGFLSLSKVVFFVSLAVSLAGIANMYFEQMRQRRSERELLRLSGMDGLRLVCTSASETLFLSAISLIFGVIVGAGVCFIIDLGLRSFGCVLF